MIDITALIVACLSLACTVYAVKTARALGHRQVEPDARALANMVNGQITGPTYDATTITKAGKQIHGSGFQASRY